MVRRHRARPGGRGRCHTTLRVQAANPTITITNQGGDPPFAFSLAQLDAKAGQAITIANNDANGVHNVTAKDQSFSVDGPPKGSTTLTITKPGNYDYFCVYHRLAQPGFDQRLLSRQPKPAR